MLQPIGPVTVPVPGTPVQVISALDANDRLRIKSPNVHGFMVQVLPTNTGKMFVGGAGMNSATLAKTFTTLGIPTATVIPSFSAALTIAPNGIDISDIWIDAEIAGEGVLVSILQT